MHGANAALAARRGFVGEARILEARRGFFEAFGGVDGKTAGEIATRDLGHDWDIMTDMAIKLVPGGHPYPRDRRGRRERRARCRPRRAEQIASITIAGPALTR